jgi:hypothetical protein
LGQVKESLIALIKEIKRSKIKIDSEALDNWNIQISQWREQHGLDHDLYLSKIKSSMIAPQVVVQELYHATRRQCFCYVRCRATSNVCCSILSFQ